MKKKTLNSLNIFSFLNGTIMTSDTHPNMFYTIFNAGLSVAVVNTANADTPEPTGIILHTQRIQKGDTTASNTIYQIFLGTNGVYKRHRINLINPVVQYSSWVQL